MQLTSVDWLVVALYFLFNLAIRYYYKSRAGKNVNEFFLLEDVKQFSPHEQHDDITLLVARCGGES